MKEISEIKQILEKNAIQERKEFSKKMIPTNQRVYGVKMPVINHLAKKYKNEGIDLAKKLWKEGSLEEQLLAAKLLGKSAAKNPEKVLELVYEFSFGIKDWAVCDTLGMQSLKPLVEKRREELWQLSNELIESKNFWQRRLALIIIEYYTRYPKEHARIKKQMDRVKNDKEYYVQKAVSWLARNLSK